MRVLLLTAASVGRAQRTRACVPAVVRFCLGLRRVGLRVNQKAIDDDGRGTNRFLLVCCFLKYSARKYSELFQKLCHSALLLTVGR